ncbi:MAG TPA: inositol monophosphatase family protein, partial [Amycolatopsis sp.]|nr:inositol monophosphatase family protein [Amycolatopsis sp.]
MTLLSSRPPRPVEPGLLSKALEVAGRLANDATDVITATAGRGAHPSTLDSPFDWVTDTDRILERHTRRVLTAEFPGIPVVGHEFGADHGADVAEYRWVVDSVDGT